MRVTKSLASVIAAVALVATPTLSAADPWKDESGQGRGRGGGEYKYEEKYDGRGQVKREWKSGGCKYEYKAGPDGVKEEYKCDGPGRGNGPPAWAPPGRGGHVYSTGLPQPPLDLGVGRCNRELLGQVLGGAAGAAGGAQIGDGRGRIAAIIGGALAGVFLGGEVGRRMDQADHLCVGQVLEHAPDGRAIEWENPDGRGQHQVVPEETYRTEDGRYCREYTARSTVGGKRVQTYGTACRQPDGSWKIVSQRS